MIPIIDIAALVNPSAKMEEKQACADTIGRACAEHGFFYTKNHGIPESRRTALFEAARDFFDLPVAEKKKLSLRDSAQFRGYTPLCGEITDGKRDYHECLDVQPLHDRLKNPSSFNADRHVLDDPGQWPDAQPEFQVAIQDAWDDRVYLSERIVEGLALSLSLPIDFFHQYSGLHLCDLRLAHYPAIPGVLPEDVDAGMGEHVDLGFLAIIDQSPIGGLEVKTLEGDWIDAPYVEGTYLINIGLMLQRWTNDTFKATLHRVRLQLDKSRYSIPYFFEPHPDSVVEPLAVCCSADNPPRYGATTVGDYFENAFSKAYKS